MAVKVVTPVATECLTVAEVKNELRIDTSTDDNLLAGLIISAREFAEKETGKRFGTQTLELVLDSFPTGDCIEFRNCSPIQSVTSFKYTDYANTEKTINAGDYIVDTDSFINRIVMGYSKEFPSDELIPANAIRIRFVGGHATVPDNIKRAMIFHIKLMYDEYESTEAKYLERARDNLLNRFKVARI